VVKTNRLEGQRDKAPRASATVLGLALLVFAAFLFTVVPTVMGLGIREVALAQDLGPFDFLAPMAWTLVIIAVLMLLYVRFFATSMKPKNRAIFAFLATALLVLGGIPILIGAFGGVGNGGEVPPGYVPQWEIIIPSTVLGSARDANTEVPGGSFTAASAITPAGTIVTSGTDLFADRVNRRITVDVSVNSALATSAAGFSAPDVVLTDFSIRLTNPVDANGDGVMDAVSYFGRVKSISRTTLVDGNSSQEIQVFYWDSTVGWYVGWMRQSSSQSSNGDWISAAPAGVADTRLPTAPSGAALDWTNLGDHSGGSAEYVSFWFLMRNYGPFGYTLPSVGESIDITIQIGTEASFVEFTFVVRLSSRS
jgi:hypothetical protein